MVTLFFSFSTKNTFFFLQCESTGFTRTETTKFFEHFICKIATTCPSLIKYSMLHTNFRICFTIQNVHIELLKFRLKFVFFLNFGLLSRNAINFCSPPPFGISIDILNKRRVVFFFTMSPWYSGTQCEMLIPRPKFKSQRVMFTLDKWTIAYWWPPPRLAIRY